MRVRAPEPAAVRICAVQDDAVDDLRTPHGVDRRRARTTRHAEEAQRARRQLIDHRFEQRDLVIERQRVGRALPVRQPGAQAVVPHDPVSARERLDELPEAGVPPVLDKMTHPPRRHDEQRSVANGGVGDPPAVELDESGLLFHQRPDYALARQYHDGPYCS